jgi:hypothetical protein
MNYFHLFTRSLFTDNYSLILLAILNILQCYRLVYHRTRTVLSVFLNDPCEYLPESGYSGNSPAPVAQSMLQ